MKVAYIFERYPSPTETFLAREVKALRRAGLDIEVYALDPSQGTRCIQLSHRAFKLLGKRRYWQRVGRALVEQLRRDGIEHIHAAWANHIADLAMGAAMSSGLPWSFAAHARDLWVEGGDLRTKMASAKFAATCTRAGETELKKFGSNVLYLPHGLELEKYKFHARKRRPRFEVVGVGRLVPKKGWLDALKAVDLLRVAGIDARLTLVGEGPLEDELMKERQRLRSRPGQLDESESPLLTLRGQQRHSRAVMVMRDCDCLVLPSIETADGDRDGLANVILEAAALGLPIVTTTAGSAADFVDESTGILVEPGNLVALSEALSRTFEEREQSAEWCRNARARVEANFDVEKNVLPLIQAFRGKGTRA